MKKMTVKKDLGQKETYDLWNGKFLDETAYDEVIKVTDEDVGVMKPIQSLDGSDVPLAYVITNAFPKESKIRENLLYELDMQNLSKEVGDVLVPSENIVEMKEGKKKIKNKVFFPGYILINMSESKEAFYLVENMSGVMSFVGAKGKPQPLRDDEITRILGEVKGREGVEIIASPFKVGDAVKVIDGPFAEFTGFVNEVNEEKQKIKVSVSIFGRPTPIELDFLQVELEK